MKYFTRKAPNQIEIDVDSGEFKLVAMDAKRVELFILLSLTQLSKRVSILAMFALESIIEVNAIIAKKLILQLREYPRLVLWDWDTIQGFGKAKVLKSSYLFLFVVPVCARLLVNIPPTVTIPVLDVDLVVPLELPFSWVVLFASACFASVGNVIYLLFCPKLVKHFRDYPAYEEVKRGGIYLRGTVKQL